MSRIENWMDDLRVVRMLIVDTKVFALLKQDKSRHTGEVFQPRPCGPSLGDFLLLSDRP